VKMSANWEVVGTWRTRASLIATSSQTKCQVDLHMLRPLMLNRVGGKVHGASVDKHGLGERTMELSQELSKPRRLGDAVSNNTVLHHGTRAGEPVAAWTTRRQGCHLGILHSQRWSGEYSDSQPSQR
jgi:hypothetical protein